jgi:hypothetical protein
MEAMMGADIHMYVEKRMPSGNWVCVRNLNETIHSKGLGVVYKDRSTSAEGFVGFWQLRNRNYELFSALANVRGDGNGPEPKGLPQDVSEYVEVEFQGWGMDAHSASWCLARDFVRVYTNIWVEVDEEKPLSPYMVSLITDGDEDAVAKFLDDMASVYVDEEESVDLYRFVFWFDN